MGLTGDAGSKRGWITLAVVVAGVVALGLGGVLVARQFEGLARAGKADVIAGLSSLEFGQLPAALASFEQAADEFGRARVLLGPDFLHQLPWLGRQLSAADDLIVIGLEGSRAGAAAVTMLNQVDAVSRTMARDEYLSQVMKSARPHLDGALVSLVAIADRKEGLSAEGLVGPLANAAIEVQEKLQPLEGILDRGREMLELERYLLDSKHRFLVVTQNSAELRPAGGFMGTYGLMEIGPDGFLPAKYTDMFELPKDTLDLPIPDGGQVNYRHFYFRNANWWMDFPTSARQMLAFWENLQQPPVDGIVAIDIPAIRDLLKVFGPIKIAESDQPLTAENVMEQLTFVVEHTRSDSSKHGKKAALLSLANALGELVARLKPEQLQPTLQILVNSANEKHLQFYLTDGDAQADLVSLGWSGALDPPAGTTDLLAVSNGVIKPSKANIGVTKSLDYEVRLQPDGSAETTLRLGYRKSKLKLLSVPQQWLANYVRAHRSPGTRLVEEGGFESLVDATGLPTFGRYFRLDRGKSTKAELKTRVPEALVEGSVPAGVDGSVPASASTADTWHYRLLLAKQADLVDTDATVTVSCPAGWKLVGSAAGYRVTGTDLPTTVDAETVTVKMPLKQDVVLDVTLARQ